MAQYLNILTTAHHDYCAEYERKLAPGLCPLLRQHVPHECGWLIISYLPPSAHVYSILVCDGGFDDEYHPDDFGDWYFMLNCEHDIIACNIYVFNDPSNDHVYEKGVNEDLCPVVQLEEFDDLITLANKLYSYAHNTTGETREQTLGYIHAVLSHRIKIAAQKPPTDVDQYILEFER